MGSSCLISCSKCFYMKELKIGRMMLPMDLDPNLPYCPI